MADTSLHLQGVALYKALVKLTPEGADRLEMNLHDIVTKGGATRPFTIDGQLNENAIKQAWRYLASIGSVENLGPRFKRALKDPAQAKSTTGTTAAPAKKAAKKTTRKSTRKATRKSTKKAAKRSTGASRSRGAARSRRPTGATRRVVAKRGASSAAANGATGTAAANAKAPTPKALSNQLSGFQAQLEKSLGTLDRLRREVNETYEQLARLEDEHNAIVNDLLAFRNGLDGSQRSFVDAIVGDNLWSYAPRA